MNTPRILALAAALLLGGCNTTLIFPVAGGEQATVILGPGGPVLMAKDGVQVLRAGMDPNRSAKALNYAFDLSFADGKAPRSVQVDDVSDSQPVLLAVDSHPYLEGGRWHFSSTSRLKGDPDIAFISTIETSTRIYRFKVVKADGAEVTIYQAVFYPAPLKVLIRHVLGMDY